MSQLPFVSHPDKVQIQPDDTRLYFFDANIWLELLNPSPKSAELRPYVQLWRRLEARGLPFVVVNPVLVSEVFNTFLRTRFNRWRILPETAEQLMASGQRQRGDSIDYKRHYRPSAEHRDLVAYLLDEFTGYTYLFEYPEPDHDLDRVILPQLLARYKADADFNDRYYAEFCQERGLTMVTHDGDFRVGNLHVVTTRQ